MEKLKVILVFLVFTIIINAQEFEGFVKYKIEAAGETTYLKYYSKDGKVRMEPEMEEMQMGGAIIFVDGKTYMLMPAQNMYMEFSEQMMNMMGGDDDSEEDVEEETKPTSTGETKDILGYTCEKWLFNDDINNVEIWAAKGLGEFAMLNVPMGDQKMPSWYDEISEGGFFPMIVKATDASGNVESKMEVVEIKEESVANSMFEIPSNYQKFSMPGGN